MGAGDWLRLLAFFALATLAGRAVLRPFEPAGGVLLRDWSAAWLAGQLLLLVGTLVTGFAAATHTALLPVVAALAALAAVLAVRAGAARAAAAAATALGWVLLAALVFPDLAMLVHRTPVVETDARAIWMFHGKALFVANGVDASFFTDPLYAWSSPDYPLLVPAQAAWSSLILGRWDDVGCRAFLWFQFAAWLRLGYTTLRARALPGWLALAAVGVLAVQGSSFLGVPGYAFVSGQADHHYALPLVLALLLVTGPAAPGRAGGGDARALAVLLLAYAANVKNEAAVYVGMFAACWVAAAAVLHVRRGGVRGLAAAARAATPSWLLAAATGLLPWAMWAAWKARHGVVSNLHVAERASSPELVADLLAARLPTVLRILRDDAQMRDMYWLLAALTALGGLSLLARRLGRHGVGVRRAELVVAAAWLAVMAMVVAIYVLTPHDFVFHMKTSVTRLLYLPHLLLLAACMLRLDALLRPPPLPEQPPPDGGPAATAVEPAAAP